MAYDYALVSVLSYFILILSDGHDKTKRKKANIEGIGMSNTQFRWLVS